VVADDDRGLRASGECEIWWQMGKIFSLSVLLAAGGIAGHSSIRRCWNGSYVRYLGLKVLRRAIGMSIAFRSTHLSGSSPPAGKRLVMSSNATADRAAVQRHETHAREPRAEAGKELEVRKVVPEYALRLLEPLLRQARNVLDADAITIAVRHKGGEQLFVWMGDGPLQQATGSLSLGLVASGPTKLAGGAGVLQAAECYSLFGFTPTAYFGAPFSRQIKSMRGGIAAWSRKTPRWRAADGALLRNVARLCVSHVESRDGVSQV
jgi:hypothetical protein